eukprot:jgi/Botrbrau1/6452/Bobra.0034s0027.1
MGLQCQSRVLDNCLTLASIRFMFPVLRCFCSSVDVPSVLKRTLPPAKNLLGSVDAQRWLSSNRNNPLESSVASVSCLNDSRGVVQISGSDAVHFVNGIITQNPASVRGSDKPLYAAFLNAQGRFLHDAFFYDWDLVAGKKWEDGDAFLVDVWRESIPNLIRLLNRYKLRSKVGVDDVTEDYSVWVRWGDHQPTENELSGKWPEDPRSGILGRRTLLHRKLPPAAVPGGSPSALLKHAAVGEAVSPDMYRLWRWQQGIAEGDVEIPSGQAVPFEFNLDGLNAIDFHKGCYVGQELVARTHFRGLVHKRLMPFTVAEPGSGLEVGADVVAEGFRRPVGRIHALEGSLGLATLRLEAVSSAAAEEKGLALGSGPGLIRPWRPAWWPAEWGHETQEASPDAS